jgi:hypothetical protein
MADFDRDQAIIGHGKKLSWSDTLAGTYVKFAGTIDIDLPSRELGAAEITNDDSEDFHKDYQPGMYEPGTLPFTYTYSAEGFAAIETLFQLATVAATRPTATKFWKIELPDGAVASFRGFLTKNDWPSPGQDETAECEAEIQVIGKMTFTEPA